MGSDLAILLGGAFTAVFAVFHLAFWKLFRWREQLPRLNRLNRAVMQVLNLCLATVFVGFAYLSFVHGDELVRSALGRSLLWLMVAFWYLRALEQIVFFGVRHRVSLVFVALFVGGGTLYAVPLLAPPSATAGTPEDGGPAPTLAAARLRSVALRVHRLEAMTAFYREAFGIRFREVETFGVTSRIGEVNGRTLELVPIREAADFEGHASHQLGFEVDDVQRVIDIAVRHGGREEGRRLRDGGREHAAVRDPDGNTIELYGPR